MSTGQLARNRALSMGSGRSAPGKNMMTEFSMPPTNRTNDFEPCDATASMFLYGQGNQVVVAHHDTLKIERRFSRHTEEVKLLAVDNISERGAGRLVISYDAGQTAIVWDLMTGDEVARFASYNDLSVAAWMRNGNVAFGNEQGCIILFEPSTSEHISARTIDSIPITALAPAADCRTYAIGYQNGSILIASLQPRFTILHNLSTSRGPSPIVTLAWHASSSRQKSDMLATQTHDGDLRVWSVAKTGTTGDAAKVVRVLKRRDDFMPGPNWLGWSKNGRIIQFSDGECTSWDVRTKNVTYENIPVLARVRGLAIYGPGATLFTLGQNNTAQQFDLNTPPVLVCDVQHPAPTLPPSPPVSIEEQRSAASTPATVDEYSSVPINLDIVSESDEEHMSPLARIAREMDALDEMEQGPNRSGALSPVSSQVSYVSRSSIASRGNGQRHVQGSTTSKCLSDHTVMSMGSSLHSREPSVASSRYTRDSVSMHSSISQTSQRSGRGRSSRLRQEVVHSPEERIVLELFKFTKARLSDIPYSQPQIPQNGTLTTEILRRRMLKVIFGFEGEAADLIRDEISRYPTGSPNRLLLNKWLGDLDADIMATSSESMTASDWMLLALSGIGGQTSQQKVARAYVQRLLEKGDVHTAATIMIGMGDQNDAIEIYVSHKRYMEALILTCYIYPADWGRQTQLIRRWGEWAVQHSQQQLAIRCFSCTSDEASAAAEPYFSPPPQQSTFAQSLSAVANSVPEMLSPPLSPPGVIPRGPQRNMAKTAALKLVTNFGDKSQKSKFFGQDGDKTPMAGGVAATPIAESALDDGNQTAFLRAPNRSVLNTPASALRTATPGGFGRARLPSIGEMPTDVTPIMKGLESTDDETGSEVSGVSASSGARSYRSRGHRRKTSGPETLKLAAVGGYNPSYNPINRATTASPMMQKSREQRSTSNLAPLPSPAAGLFSAEKQAVRHRNGSRDRKPTDLQLQWPPMESIMTGDYLTTPELTGNASQHRTPTAHSVTGSVVSVSSVSSTGRNPRSDIASPPLTGRSLDPYISSLDTARQERMSRKARDASKDQSGKTRNRSSSRKRAGSDAAEGRGRSAARYNTGKRSPTSPVPMSPEDLRGLGADFGYGDDRSDIGSSYSQIKARKARDASQATAKPGSRTASRARRSSPDVLRSDTGTVSRPGSRQTARMTSRSRKASPDGSVVSSIIKRGRSKDGRRSPSSPVPMSPDAYYRKAEEDLDNVEEDGDLRAAKAAKERFRSRQRSQSRARGASSRPGSPDRKQRARSASRQGRGRTDGKSKETEVADMPSTLHNRSLSDKHKAGDLQAMGLERARKKESAARELEERRRSLVRRPEGGPPVVHPEQLSPAVFSGFRPASRGTENLRSDTYSPANLPVRSQTVSPESMRLASTRFQEPERTRPAIGLPATPKAMQHPKYDPDNKDVPDVPQIPESFNSSQPTQAMGSLNAIANPRPATAGIEDTLGPLPSTTFSPLPKTTYQAAARGIPRSMSAPIPEEPLSPNALPASLPTHPAFHAALPASSRRRTDDTTQYAPSRKVNNGDASPGTLGYGSLHNGPPMSLDAALSDHKNDNMTPPPPPPVPQQPPPILRELQHLAKPPPPPPAPLYRMLTTSPENVGPRGTGIIEIVMDDETTDDEGPQNAVRRVQVGSRNSNESRSSNEQDNHGPPPPPPTHHNTPPPQHQTNGYSTLPTSAFAAQPSQSSRYTPPIHQTPQPQQQVLPPRSASVVSESGHHRRGRSSTDIITKQHDNSLSSRFTRATERMRSASRGPGSLVGRTISPPIESQGTLNLNTFAGNAAPYESNVSFGGIQGQSGMGPTATQRWVMERSGTGSAMGYSNTGTPMPGPAPDTAYYQMQRRGSEDVHGGGMQSYLPGGIGHGGAKGSASVVGVMRDTGRNGEREEQRRPKEGLAGIKIERHPQEVRREFESGMI